jgi:hypothetical protein
MSGICLKATRCALSNAPVACAESGRGPLRFVCRSSPDLYATLERGLSAPGSFKQAITARVTKTPHSQVDCIHRLHRKLQVFDSENRVLCRESVSFRVKLLRKPEPAYRSPKDVDQLSGGIRAFAAARAARSLRAAIVTSRLSSCNGLTICSGNACVASLSGQRSSHLGNVCPGYKRATQALPLQIRRSAVPCRLAALPPCRLAALPSRALPPDQLDRQYFDVRTIW